MCAGGGCEAAGAAILGAAVVIQQNWQKSGAPQAIERWLNGILHNEQAAQPTHPLPEKPVGENPKSSSGKAGLRSGPLAADNGGTGDSERDFNSLTGGRASEPPPSKGYPAGTKVGDNGIARRPPAEGKGARIDIPANGPKPHETLHYPAPKPPPPPDAGG